MTRLARFVVAHRWWVIGAWLVLAVAGGYAAPHATAALTFDFGLPGQPGYETNRAITAEFGRTGGDNPPLLLAVVGDDVDTTDPQQIVDLAATAAPGARIAGWGDHPELRAADGRAAVVMVYPPAIPGAETYGDTLPALQQATAASGLPVVVTGEYVLSSQESGGGGADVLAETLFGGIGALVVLALVFGSFLALTPLIVAIGSILTTFLILWGLTSFTDVSFIVQYLLALIGLGVAIDYALLIVTRWREQRGSGADPAQAIANTLTTAGRSVLFSGITVAVSLAALITLPVPFLRSVGITGLLIPLLSVAAALTLLPALLLVVGDRLSWPHRRRSAPDSRLWHAIGTGVVRYRWVAVVASIVVLGALAAPLIGLRLGPATNESLASVGGEPGTAIRAVDASSIGSGLTQPVEILTDRTDDVVAAVRDLPGVAGVVAPSSWRDGSTAVVDAWTAADTSTSTGAAAVGRISTAARDVGARVGGLPAQNGDFIDAVYGNAWWIGLIIVAVTFALLAVALRSIVLPVKALLLNVVSLAAAYGVTVLIWQDGVGTSVLFGQTEAGAITVWVPVAVFAFLFGLSMDYEVFLLSRIREEHDAGLSTDAAAVTGVSRTGRLVTSGALILFLAFVSLSRVPTTAVKVLATGLAVGIALDATVVRGVLAPALVAGLGRANWWLPRRWQAWGAQRSNL